MNDVARALPLGMHWRWVLVAALLPVACGSKPAARSVAPAPAASANLSATDPCLPVLATLLGSLKRPVRIEAYVTRGAPELDAFVDTLGALLESYRTAAPRVLEYVIVEAKDEATRQHARAAGFVERPIEGAAANGGSARGFMGIGVHCARADSVYPFVPPDLAPSLPILIGQAISTVRDKADDIHHKVGVLAGHREIQLTEANLLPAAMGTYSIQSILEKNFAEYAPETVDLGGGDVAIPDDLDGLVITQPAVDITERELRRIDEFVMKGKALAVFASAVNVKAGDASMRASLSLHGLDELLRGYGISVRHDVVVDPFQGVRVEKPVDSGQVAANFPQVLHVQSDSKSSMSEERLDAAFLPFFGVDDVAVPFASSLTLQPERQPKARMHVVMRSSRYAASLSGASVDLRPFQPWAPRLGGQGEQQFAVAAVVGGTLATAFPTGEAHGVDTPAESLRAARVFVLSSSQFFANPLARAGNQPDTAPLGPEADAAGPLLAIAAPYAEAYLKGAVLVFKNTVDWFAEDSDLLACVGHY
jgi:ABC-type uncharacterized transport system